MTDAQDPRNASTHCPSCGRFVGAREVCPYCSASIPRRMSLRVFKYGAIVLALVGLVTLWAASIWVQVPLVRVGDVVGTMNWAYVRLEGIVTRLPSYDRETGYLSFRLRDDTGDIMVSAYRNEAQALVAAGRVPTLGDRVSVEGTLKVKEDLVTLTVGVPDKVGVARPTPTDTRIGDITAQHEWQRVRVHAVVRQVREPYEGLTLVELRDATGVIDLSITEAVANQPGGLARVQPGQAVVVVAPVSLYREEPQLTLVDPADLRAVDEEIPLAETTRIDALSAAHVGRFVRVQGTIARVTPFSAGVKFALAEGAGAVTILVWQSLYEGLAEREGLIVGSRVAFQGIVSEYRGELEILPEHAMDVVVLQAGPGQPAPAPPPGTPVPQPTPVSTAASTPPTVALADLPGLKGQTVTVEAQVTRAESFSRGMRYALDDGTGVAVLLLWQDVYDRVPDQARLGVGVRVRATGLVDEYEGDWEVIPGQGADVAVTGGQTVPAPTPAPAVPIGSLEPGLKGQAVTIDGYITSVYALSGGQGIRYIVADGSGEIVLLLWQDVYDAVADKDRLVEGVRVRATGKLDVYKGELEIVPQAGVDVLVLQ